MSKARRLSPREDVELAIGATGAVVATDQAIKFVEHLLKARIGAAVAIGAYEVLRRAELDPKASPGQHHHSSSSSQSRRGSNSSGLPHHSRHIFEEIIGAYTLGKELL